MNTEENLLDAKIVVVPEFVNTEDGVLDVRNAAVLDCVNTEDDVLNVKNAAASEFVNTGDDVTNAADVIQAEPIEHVNGMPKIGRYLSNYLSKTSNGLYLIRVHHAANLLNQ